MMQSFFQRWTERFQAMGTFIRSTWIGRALGFLSLPVALVLLAFWEPDQEPPIFDVQVQYNADAWEGYTASGLIRTSKRMNVKGMVVSSAPNEGTLRLLEADREHVVPLFKPYRSREDRDHWLDNPDLLEWTRRELSLGRYRGIGEIHLYDGRVDLPVVRELVALAAEQNLLLNVHAEADVLRQLLGFDRRIRVMWAHTGLKATTRQVGELLEFHSNLYAELSHRGDIAPEGKLAPEWRSLFERFPNRFMIGSGTYNNEFWYKYGQTLTLNREWLRQLPPALAERIAFKNAQDLFATP